jgi:hypothetical protein
MPVVVAVVEAVDEVPAAEDDVDCVSERDELEPPHAAKTVDTTHAPTRPANDTIGRTGRI